MTLLFIKVFSLKYRNYLPGNK